MNPGSLTLSLLPLWNWRLSTTNPDLDATFHHLRRHGPWLMSPAFYRISTLIMVSASGSLLLAGIPRPGVGGGGFSFSACVFLSFSLNRIIGSSTAWFRTITSVLTLVSTAVAHRQTYCYFNHCVLLGFYGRTRLRPLGSSACFRGFAQDLILYGLAGIGTRDAVNGGFLCGFGSPASCVALSSHFLVYIVSSWRAGNQSVKDQEDA
ncbi:hypothetical protein VTJ04DRAFT_7616 [Mycothermus thermophilus]|uniref:uncharacterized protein n=1 Tax=Humicola insolens TaxID=85995 RepID=UPI003742C07B